MWVQMRKVDMLRKGQEGHVRAERDVLKGAALATTPTGAEWIVRLFYSFQDTDHLYLVSWSIVFRFPGNLHKFGADSGVYGRWRFTESSNRERYFRRGFCEVLYRRGGFLFSWLGASDNWIS